MIVTVKCKSCGTASKINVKSALDISSIACPVCGKETLTRTYESVGVGRVISTKIMTVSQNTLKG